MPRSALPADWIDRSRNHELQAEIATAIDVHREQLRKGEEVDYWVLETYRVRHPKSGPVIYAIQHPAGNVGFRCLEEAEESIRRLKRDPIRQTGTDAVQYDIKRRTRWRDGDRLREGTTGGLPAHPSEVVTAQRAKAIRERIAQAASKLGATP